MADIRLPASGASLTPPSRVGAGRTEAARAAQRAFFEAALAAPASSPAVQSRITAAAPTQAVRPEAPEAGRILRPGSLLDIKV